MPYQLYQALLFYLVFSLFAAIGWPIVSRFVSHKMLAYVSSKPIGLLLFGYCIWLQCELHFIDYQNRGLIIALLLAFGLLACTLMYFSKKAAAETTLSYSELLFAEGIMLAVYFAYLWVRSHNSSGGSEKFMDMALFSAAGKTHFFPFIDPWYGSKTVNYYYYGHYLMSLISNLADIPYVLSYNFSLGIIYTTTALLSATWVYAITGSKKCGTLAAFLVTSAGTLYFAERTGFEWLRGKSLSLFTSSHFYEPSYTIREIPSYSFTVGDLHAHLIALPFFLVNLILIHSFITTPNPRRALIAVMLPAFATSAMINSWDFITLIILTAVAITFKFVIPSRKILPLTSRYIAEPVIVFFAIAVGAFLLTKPYFNDFQTPVLGIGFIPSFVRNHHLQDVQYPTAALALLGMWGIFFVSFILYLATAAEDTFQIALAVTVLLLIIGMELFFVRDIYSIANPPYFRSNTTFKFGFHAWVLSSLVFSIWIDKLIRLPRLAPYSWALVILALAGGSFYPYQAARQYFFDNTSKTTLNAVEWLKAYNSGDYETINYINQNVRERAVVAEAVGDSYSNYSRIATYTGMITPMGWQSHEWGWRFHPALPDMEKTETGWAAIAAIGGDIHTLYSTPDTEQTARIIKQYHIHYVYVGDMERHDYPELQEEKFRKMGTLVFSYQGSKLYKINDE